MIINTSEFGKIEINENEILTFEEGILGFEDVKSYILLKDEEIFLEWLQSTEEEVSFALADPFLLKKDYEFEVPENVLEKLGITSPEQVSVRTVVIIPPEIEKIRTNLQAPILFNKENKKGMQIILSDDYPLKYEFYHKAGE